MMCQGLYPPTKRLELKAEDIIALGHGGFCSQCPECHYPVCPFCK